MAATAKLLQLCPTLCDPIDSSPPGSPLPGILQAKTLEWVAISFSNAWKQKVKSESEVAQSYPTLSNPMDCSLPGFSIHGIFQARVLEWVAIAFSMTKGIRAYFCVLFSVPLIYVCFCANVMLVWLLLLCSIVWSLEELFLQLCSFSSGLTALAILGFLWYHINFRVICFSSVKNILGNLRGITFNL